MHLLIPILALALAAPAFAFADPVVEALAKMDAASGAFTGVKTDLRKSSYTAIIDDETIEIGTMWMARQGGKAAKVRMKIDFTEPDERSVAFSGRKGEIYYPKIQTVHEYDLGKHKSLVESFLLLGFGTSGKQLAKDYNVKLAGETEIGGIPSYHLELISKNKKAREKIVKVELWIAKDGAYPVQQKFLAPSNDTTTITFSNIDLNPKLTDADLALKLPPGVKREFPGK